jgi:hypothetical protein
VNNCLESVSFFAAKERKEHKNLIEKQPKAFVIIQQIKSKADNVTGIQGIQADKIKKNKSGCLSVLMVLSCSSFLSLLNSFW